jgi:hypothetical protein
VQRNSGWPSWAFLSTDHQLSTASDGRCHFTFPGVCMCRKKGLIQDLNFYATPGKQPAILFVAWASTFLAQVCACTVWQPLYSGVVAHGRVLPATSCRRVDRSKLLLTASRVEILLASPPLDAMI